MSNHSSLCAKQFFGCAPDLLVGSHSLFPQTCLGCIPSRRIHHSFGKLASQGRCWSGVNVRDPLRMIPLGLSSHLRTKAPGTRRNHAEIIATISSPKPGAKMYCFESCGCASRPVRVFACPVLFKHSPMSERNPLQVNKVFDPSRQKEEHPPVCSPWGYELARALWHHVHGDVCPLAIEVFKP